MSGLPGSRVETLTSRSRDERVTARPTDRLVFLMHYLIQKMSSFTILVSPTLKISDERVTVEKATALHITCNASGNPTPTVTWWKRQNQIVNSSRLTLVMTRINQEVFSTLFVNVCQVTLK